MFKIIDDRCYLGRPHEYLHCNRIAYIQEVDFKCYAWVVYTERALNNELFKQI